MNKINLLKISILVLFTFACHESSESATSMNYINDDIDSLKLRIRNLGDSSAYRDFYIFHLDTGNSEELFYYSYLMAFKYHDRVAYQNVFSTICEMNDVNINSEKLDISKLDSFSKKLLFECYSAELHKQYTYRKDIETYFSK